MKEVQVQRQLKWRHTASSTGPDLSHLDDPRPTHGHLTLTLAVGDDRHGAKNFKIQIANGFST